MMGRAIPGRYGSLKRRYIRLCSRWQIPQPFTRWKSSLAGEAALAAAASLCNRNASPGCPVVITEARDRRNTPSGFTLLEVLIVIIILGLILAALSSGVRFAGKVWQVQQRDTTVQGDLD